MTGGPAHPLQPRGGSAGSKAGATAGARPNSHSSSTNAADRAAAPRRGPRPAAPAAASMRRVDTGPKMIRLRRSATFRAPSRGGSRSGVRSPSCRAAPRGAGTPPQARRPRAAPRPRRQSPTKLRPSGRGSSRLQRPGRTPAPCSVQAKAVIPTVSASYGPSRPHGPGAMATAPFEGRPAVGQPQPVDRPHEARRDPPRRLFAAAAVHARRRRTEEVFGVHRSCLVSVRAVARSRSSRAGL